MEKELIRNLKLAAIRNPGRSASLVHSFVTDLSFWDVECSDASSGISTSGSNYSRNGRNSRSRSKIPSLAQAMAIHEEEEKKEMEASSSSSWIAMAWVKLGILLRLLLFRPFRL